MLQGMWCMCLNGEGRLLRTSFADYTVKLARCLTCMVLFSFGIWANGQQFSEAMGTSGPLIAIRPGGCREEQNPEGLLHRSHWMLMANIDIPKASACCLKAGGETCAGIYIGL